MAQMSAATAAAMVLQQLTSTASDSLADPLTQWRKASNKDNLAHYANEQLRRQYAQHEMPKRSRDARKWLRKPVRRLLEARVAAAAAAAAADSSPVLQLLSLGCGPGSDLLGALHCLDEAGKDGRPHLAVECTGVDLHHWGWTNFSLHRVAVASQMSGSALKVKFQQEDMRTFVAESLCKGAKFDLITMSYANAKEALVPSLMHQLPQLLRAGGSIVIIDNDSSKLRGLCSRNRSYKMVYKKCKKIVIVCEK